VQLAYFDGASPVFLVITDTVPLPTAGTTAVLLLSSLQLYSIQYSTVTPLL
jgi:hypothetical protein